MDINVNQDTGQITSEKKPLKIGWAVCGSFCTIADACAQMEQLLSEGEKKEFTAEIEFIPIVSYHVCSIDTRFGKAADVVAQIEKICGRNVIRTIDGAEVLGPKTKLDALVIAPCTGNTLAKLALGVTDTPVTMAAKAHLRNERPLLIALATNDALSTNLKNIAVMQEKKRVYMVPLIQDDPQNKPHSLVCDFTKIPAALKAVFEGKQLRPLFL